MIWKLAWRNVWRSKTRSLVVIGAVMIAIWALLFILSFVQGITLGYIDNAIKYQTSHIQIHQPEYLEDNLIQFTIPGSEDILSFCESSDQVEAASPRVVINGMIATSHGARGAQIRGVDPGKDSVVMAISQSISEGVYFKEDGRNQIVIGASLADKLNTGLRKKVVVTFQTADKDIGTAAFRISGLYKTNNKAVDDLMVFVQADDIRRIAGLPEGSIHEIGISVVNVDSVDAIASAIQRNFPELRVQTFEEIAPELALFNSQVKINMIIMTTIIMLALIFGIINTMLMAVLERTREIGMLMAIGMKKPEIFMMIVAETFYVSLVGAPVGILLGFATTEILRPVGIDLSFWSQGLAEFGMSTIIYPDLDSDAYLLVAVSIVITALFAAIFPSRRAVKLRPIEAMHKI